MALVCGCYERCVIGLEVGEVSNDVDEVQQLRRSFSYAASMVRAHEKRDGNQMGKPGRPANGS